ncbi:MmgE/PrpD family protein [Humitalea sp. 24SJ18S-53]|uniref:MmgE/PrpD family protein n=1 Tax=Humitalea sp. 24SJ18S-53 TaxID=3422307 RepID=UPI003D675B95
MTLARRIVRSLAELARGDLPAPVMAAGRLHLLDAIGVGLAAAGSPVGAPYRAFASNLREAGVASLLGGGGGASAASAALVNGGLVHSLEYDDTHTGSIVHPSAVLMPAALAVAEQVGASSHRMLGAYVLGYELLVRIGRAAPGGFQAQAFQVTSVAGTLAAAIIAAELYGLGEDSTVAALGIALSQSSGVFEFLSNGSTVKSLHPGWAAHGGVIAAQLAQAGMTGPETAIEGKRGLFQAFTRDPDAAARFAVESDDIGYVWHVLDAAFKFSPCCHYLHPFVEAAGLLVARGVRPEAIAEIVCEVPLGADAVICEPWADKLAAPTGHSGRWSLPIVVAARIVEGRVDLATFEQPASAAVRALAQRISWQPLAGANFPSRFEAVVTCVTRDGARHQVRIDDAYGNRSRPPAVEEVLGKFRVNAALSLSPDAVADLEAALMSDDMARVSAALRGNRRM